MSRVALRCRASAPKIAVRVRIPPTVHRPRAPTHRHVRLKDGEEGIAVKWFLLAVGMFVGATALFAMVPGPALLGVAGAAVRTFYALVNIDGRITNQASGQERTTVHRVETSATALSGRARVVDGDTIDVGGARVRLHGVDAPESGQSCVVQGERWPCGRRATRALAGRLGGRTVVCEERDRDRYGRIVAVCQQGGRDINAWLVAEGWALSYRRYSRDYMDEESTARAARKGVWRGEFVAPWDWRRGERLHGAARQTRPAEQATSKRCNIKGNISHNSGRRIYHMPGDRDYARTRISPSRGERWFCTEAEARAAGWRRAGR